MDEFEKIRAFSEQMSRQTEEAVAKEEAEVAENYSQEGVAFKGNTNNPNFLEEWNTENNVQEPASKSLSKTFWLVFSLTTLVLIALIVVFWLLLRTPMEKGAVVSIAPTPNAVKVKPENPGGVVIPDQDKEIYTRLTHDTVPVRVEKLVETQEEIPVLPPVATEEVIDEVELPEEIKVITEVDVPAQPEVIPVVKSDVKPVQKAQTSTQKEGKKTQNSEKWHVQLFSSSDKAKVEATWKTISVKHKQLLSNMPMDIEKAEISGKGTFYRLKVGEFPSKERAANLCSKLKKKKQDCFPVK